jgi:hypothetical protein
MSESALEKLAMAASQGIDLPTPWERLSPREQGDWRRAIRAALAKLPSVLPDEAFQNEAIAYHSGPYAVVEVRREFNSLIRRILTEGPDTNAETQNGI